MKILGWQGFLDNSDPERDRGLSDFDVDHRLGRQLRVQPAVRQRREDRGNATAAKNAVIGGWQINGIDTVEAK